MDELSVYAAARESPQALAITDGVDSLTFAALAERVRDRIEALPRDRGSRTPFPVIGAVSLETAITLYALFELGIPALLLHPRLTQVERDALLKAATSSGPLPGERPCVVVHTSGTTGVPRAAVLSQAALVASAQASASNLGWEDRDRWLICMPLAHVGGLSILTRCLVARRCAVLRGRFDPVAFPEWVRTCDITLASMVPAMLDRVLHEHPSWSPPPWLRAVLIGGAGASPRLLARAAERRIPLVLSYGLTETCAQITATRYASRMSPAREGSGFALPGVELRISGGRIEVRGATMMSGYWNEQALPSGEWFDTGDIGEIDPSGCLTVHARRVDLIVTGGENVYPAEVEATIEEHPAVAAAAVFGISDETWGHVVAVALVAREPPSDEALRAWMSQRLAPHKRPRAICNVESLPLTNGGKLDRAALAAFTPRLRRI